MPAASIMNLDMCMNKTAIISGEYDFLSKAMDDLGVDYIQTGANSNIAKEVSFHPDMQVLVTPFRTFVLKGGKQLKGKLQRLGISIQETYKFPESKYPGDVLCNAKFLGNKIICNSKTIDISITEYCKAMDYKIIHVNQGYSGCSICKISDNAIISGDKMICKKAAENNIDALYIDDNEIILPGYDHGFIGGCTGLISESCLIFTGELNACSFGKSFKEFANRYGVDILEIHKGKPLDVGGVVII